MCTTPTTLTSTTRWQNLYSVNKKLIYSRKTYASENDAYRRRWIDNYYIESFACSYDERLGLRSWPSITYIGPVEIVS